MTLQIHPRAPRRGTPEHRCTALAGCPGVAQGLGGLQAHSPRVLEPSFSCTHHSHAHIITNGLCSMLPIGIAGASSLTMITIHPLVVQEKVFSSIRPPQMDLLSREKKRLSRGKSVEVHKNKIYYVIIKKTQNKPGELHDNREKPSEHAGGVIV